jgi:hypothetical protein
LDTEKFNDPLEPFQLNSAVDKHDLKTEESLTIKLLEHLGITKEYLIYSNINLINGAAASSSSATSTSTLMSSLISNKNLALLLNQPHYYKNYSSIPIEIKQYINGAYRIVFHSVQKRMRHEYSSEYKVDSYFNTLYNSYLTARSSLNNMSGTKTKRDTNNEAPNSNSASNSYNSRNSPSSNNQTELVASPSTNTQNGRRNSDTLSHRSATGGKNSTKFDDSDDYAENKSIKNGEQNSIFVRLNSNNPSPGVLAQKDPNVNGSSSKTMNQNSIFVKVNANATNGGGKPGNGQSLSPYTYKRNGEMIEGGGNNGSSSARSSPSQNSGKSMNNRVGPANGSPNGKVNPQSSKLCTVL